MRSTAPAPSTSTCQHYTMAKRRGTRTAVACRRPSAWRLTTGEPRQQAVVCEGCLRVVVEQIARMQLVLIEPV